MAYTSKGTSTPKTELAPGQYPGIFRAPIKDEKLPDKFIKNPETDDGIRAKWWFEVVNTGDAGDGERVSTLTSTYLSVDEKGEPKSGAAKLCTALNFGRKPWTDKESMREFDWESLDGRPVLLDIDVSDSGYAKVKSFSALPKAMWPLVQGRANLPASGVTSGRPAPTSTQVEADRRSVDDINAELAATDGDVPF